jgi:hypothetical protein
MLGSPTNQAGRRAFFLPSPITQRHTVDRHDLETDRRFRSGGTGQLEASAGSSVKVLSRRALAAARLYRARIGARYAWAGASPRAHLDACPTL